MGPGHIRLRHAVEDIKDKHKDIMKLERVILQGEIYWLIMKERANYTPNVCWHWNACSTTRGKIGHNRNKCSECGELYEESKCWTQKGKEVS